MDPPNDESSPIDSIIDVDFDLHVKYGLPMHGSTNFGVDISSLVDATTISYTTKDFKVDDTHISNYQ